MTKEKQNDLLYQVGVTLLDGVGDITAKKLIAYCGGAEGVFSQKKTALMKIPGIGDKLASQILGQEVLQRAEEEVEYILKHNIKPLFFIDKEFPERLKHCEDSPVLIYTKGNINFNAEKVISIVGTRNATEYGKEVCEKFVESLKDLDVLVISGLAYGIDIYSHRAALKHGLSTVGVLAHGLDRLYPAVHKKTAEEMQENGGLATEFMINSNPDRENFPKRNRIIAGLADATLVIEAGMPGGALITAELANGYNRDVFAVPGRIGDKYSEGCNWLINRNKAVLTTSVENILYMMNWQKEDGKAKKPVQKQLFVDLNDEQQLLVDILNDGQLSIDNICLKAQMPMSKVAANLLDLEFSGVVASLPGKVFKLN